MAKRLKEKAKKRVRQRKKAQARLKAVQDMPGARTAWNRILSKEDDTEDLDSSEEQEEESEESEVGTKMIVLDADL